MQGKDHYTEESVQLAKFCKALAHPARITILKLLFSREECICSDIVREIPLAQSTVSRHLKELKTAGLIQGNITPPQIKYCINRQNWAQARKQLEKFFE